MNMFFVAGMGVALLIELLLISKKNKSTSDNILTAWMFLILVHLFLFYVGFTEDVYNFAWILGFEQPLPLLHGVFLYLYVAILTDQAPKNRKALLLHFIPAIVTYAYLIATFLFLPIEQKIEVYRNKGAGFELFTAVKSFAIMVSGAAYVVWSALLLNRHQQNIREQFSDVEQLNLRWLQILTFGLGGIWFLVIFFGGDPLIFSGAVLFIFFMGFFGIRQANIFTEGALKAENSTPGEQKEKYQKSGLSEQASEELHLKLKSLMAEETMYKQSDLSINDLSSKLGVHPNYLSQVINQKEKKNFYDFVNTYRVEEFKRLISIQKNRQYTLLSLAHDCGFSSKTSFNRFFKKTTGQTPSEYVSALSETTNPS